MRTALIALAVGGALAAFAAPALAQTSDPNITQREDNIRYRIDQGVRFGDLTYDQARRLRSELAQIDSLDQRYQYEGMSDRQVADLNSRLDLLASRVNYDVSMTRDSQSYGSGYYR